MADFDSSLPVRTQTAGDVIAKICDATTNTQQLAIDATGRPTVNQGAPNTASNGWPVKPTDGTNSQSFTASGEAKVDLTVVSGSAITLGQKTMANSFPVVISSDQTAVPVVIVDSTGSGMVNDYKSASAVAAGASDDHDYVVTALKTLTLKGVKCAASGKARFNVQVETGVGTGIFNSYYNLFVSTAEGNALLELSEPMSVAAGVTVRVHATNRDLTAQDLYSTIEGSEV